MVVDQHLSAIGLIEPCNQAKERGLAAAGRPQQHPELSDVPPFPGIGVFNLKIDILQRVNFLAVGQTNRLCHFAAGDLILPSFHASPLSNATLPWNLPHPCPRKSTQPGARERAASPEMWGGIETKT